MWSIILTILHILVYPYLAGVFFTSGVIVGSNKVKLKDKWDYIISIFFCIIWPITLLIMNDKIKEWLEVQTDKVDVVLSKWLEKWKHRKTDKAFSKRENENRLERMGFKNDSRNHR